MVQTAESGFGSPAGNAKALGTAHTTRAVLRNCAQLTVTALASGGTRVAVLGISVIAFLSRFFDSVATHGGGSLRNTGDADIALCISLAKLAEAAAAEAVASPGALAAITDKWLRTVDAGDATWRIGIRDTLLTE